MGELAEPQLRKTFIKPPSLEVRERVAKLLEKIDARVPRGDELGSLRAVEVLEYIGTPEVRPLLQRIAAGAAGASVTREAKVVLQRLK